MKGTGSPKDIRRVPYKRLSEVLFKFESAGVDPVTAVRLYFPLEIKKIRFLSQKTPKPTEEGVELLERTALRVCKV